ncbi:MAG: hypothetical protein ACRYFZ_21075 [Janthinobacterium lividum]
MKRLLACLLLFVGLLAGVATPASSPARLPPGPGLLWAARAQAGPLLCPSPTLLCAALLPLGTLPALRRPHLLSASALLPPAGPSYYHPALMLLGQGLA